jgi:gag-polypeptide of LTR copia-type/Zinc knuckle
MWYDPDMSMQDWITKVEELACHLEAIKSPMIPIDIINTLTHDLPDSYAPFVVLINSLLDDPNYVADLVTVQEVIKHLLNEEAWQAEANHIDIGTSALLARNHRKPTTCYNCGESSHLRFDCDLTPWEV